MFAYLLYHLIYILYSAPLWQLPIGVVSSSPLFLALPLAKYRPVLTSFTTVFISLIAAFIFPVLFNLI